MHSAQPDGHRPPHHEPRNRITIVVPVYSDLGAIEACIISVLEHADEEWIDLLVVNDCGPEADVVERRIQGLIAGHPRARYRRNESNLGFVKTCNRAVTDYDQTDNDILLLNSDAVLTPGAVAEMREVLASSERHGAVCPRSNDATIASIPVFHTRQGKVSPARASAVFKAVSPALPRYYVSPVAIGFCILIRRRLIRNYGLFDEVYGAGYNEENDFCLRINEYGYSSLIANHALVFHTGSTSFGEERRAQLEAENREHLLTRFPFYPEVVTRFVRFGFSLVDRFADFVVRDMGAPRRILLDIHHLSYHYDGTTKNVLSLLEYLVRTPPPPDIEIVIGAYRETTEFFRLEDYGFRVIDYAAIDEVFDLGIALVPVTSVGQLMTLHRACARIAVSYLDVIALRTLRHARQTPMKGTVVQLTMRWADRVLAISDGALDDLDALYPGAMPGFRDRARVIVQGSGRGVGTDHSSLTSSVDMDARTLETIAQGGYVLVVGNGFAHKQVVDTLLALEPLSGPVVAMADRLIGARFPAVSIALSGTLTEREVDDLYDRADVVVCPSAYEGFGLSLAEAAQHGKRAVVFETEIAREVVDRLELENVTWFSTFDELPAAIDRARSQPPIEPTAIRSLADYAEQYWSEAVSVLDEPLDIDRLRGRDAELAPLSIVSDATLGVAEDLLAENREIKTSTSFRLALRIAGVVTAVRTRGRVRFRPPPLHTHSGRSVIDQT